MVRGGHARRRARRFNRRNPEVFPADASLVNCVYAYARYLACKAIWRHLLEEERRVIYGTGTGKPLGIIRDMGGNDG